MLVLPHPCQTPSSTLLLHTQAVPLTRGGGRRYVVPLLVAATFAGALTRVLALRQWSAWVTPASGVLLLVGGTYTLLSRLVPA